MIEDCPIVHFLRTDILDLYFIDTWKMNGNAKEHLSTDEQKRAREISQEAKRSLYINRKSALRKVLAWYTGKKPSTIKFAYVNKKPMLTDDHHFFNLSHCGNMMLVGVSKCHPVGVDIERIRDKVFPQSMLEEILTKEEIVLHMSLPWRKRVGMFYETWTKKESISKAIGLGLAIDFKDLPTLGRELAYNGNTVKIETFGVYDGCAFSVSYIKNS